MSYGPDEWDADTDFDGWYTDETGWRIRGRFDTLGARHVLEVGCGTGRMTALLASKDRRVVATDRSEAMLSIARSRGLPLVAWSSADLNVLEREELPFDAIVCTLLLHEVDEPRHMGQWFRRLLAPGGRVFVTVPSMHSVHHAIAPLENRYSERAARFGVKHVAGSGWWRETLTDGTGLRVTVSDEMMLKPFPNAQMACLAPKVLEYLAGYRGPGGALCYFELEAED